MVSKVTQKTIILKLLDMINNHDFCKFYVRKHPCGPNP